MKPKDERVSHVDADAASFDLTCRPWVPVQMLDGREHLLSLREVFEQADGIRRLAGDIATQDFALTRLLLAILHDALEGPRDVDEWAELWETEQPFGPIDGYLDEHRQRFDLLHPKTPFFQTPGLRTAKGEVFSLDRITADVPNGVRFFTMRALGAERLSFAEAARWVVHAQTYDTSGIKTGVEGDPRAKNGKVYPQGVAWSGSLGGVLAEGGTLRRTLLLNLVAAEADVVTVSDEDKPAWCRPVPEPGPAKDVAERPYGPCDLYTWQSRRLLLHHDEDCVHAVVLTYGDPLTPQNRHKAEPMTGWRRSKPQEKKLGQPLVYMPREHDPARSAWRGLASLLAPRALSTASARDAANELRPGVVHWLAQLMVDGVLPQETLIRLRTYGVKYGTQQSVIDEVTDDSVAMAVVLLHEDDSALGRTALDAVGDADASVRALGDLARDLALAAGSDPGTRQDSAREAGYDALDTAFRDWLSRIRPGDEPERIRTEWQRTVRRIVKDSAGVLISAAGEAAWAGRTVATKHGERHYDAALADRLFRIRLRKALPLAHDSEDPS